MISDYDFYNQVVTRLKQELAETKIELSFLKQSKFYFIYSNWHRFKNILTSKKYSSSLDNSISQDVSEVSLLSNEKKIDPSKKIIILFSHDASITGAPKVLIELADLIKRDLNFEVVIFFLGKGDLIKQVENNHKVFYFNLNNY
jgi:hypothetical protein